MNLLQRFPSIFPLLGAVVMALLEFSLGVYLLFGIHKRWVSKLMLVVMLAMTPLTLWLALANPISDCGCFGDVLVLSNWETFFKNLVLLLAAFSIYKWYPRIHNLVTDKVDWLIAMYSSLFIFGFSLYCYRQLPVFDFRPYYIGANIREGMEIPEVSRCKIPIGDIPQNSGSQYHKDLDEHMNRTEQNRIEQNSSVGRDLQSLFSPTA